MDPSARGAAGEGAAPGRRRTVLYSRSGSRLDEIDLAILRHLSAVPRSSNIALAQAIGLSASACLARTRRLESSGTLRIRADVDESVVADWQMYWLFARLRPVAAHDRAAFEERIQRSPHVLEAHELLGDYEYLLKVTAPAMADMPRLRAALDPDARLIERATIAGGVRLLKDRALHPLIRGPE